MMQDIGRRRVLKIAAGSAMAALLAACGSSTAPTATSGGPRTHAPAAHRPCGLADGSHCGIGRIGHGAGRAPAAQATTGAGTATSASPVAQADGFFPSPAPNVPDAYTKLPPSFKSVNAVPGKGDKVTAFLIGYNPPVPGRSSNKYWQELEKRLGVTFEPTVTPAASYVEKLTAIIASGDIPDLTLLQLEYSPDQNRLMLQGAYTDLTPYVTGDALKNYPNLARFPPQLWKNIARKGKIYGVPVPNLIAQNTLMFRQDWAEKVGFAQMKNADDFLNCMVAFAKNDPAGNGTARHLRARFERVERVQRLRLPAHVPRAEPVAQERGRQPDAHDRDR